MRVLYCSSRHPQEMIARLKEVLYINLPTGRSHLRLSRVKARARSPKSLAMQARIRSSWVKDNDSIMKGDLKVNRRITHLTNYCCSPRTGQHRFTFAHLNRLLSRSVDR
jgi:hypothetical protein